MLDSNSWTAVVYQCSYFLWSLWPFQDTEGFRTHTKGFTTKVSHQRCLYYFMTLRYLGHFYHGWQGWKCHLYNTNQYNLSPKELSTMQDCYRILKIKLKEKERKKKVDMSFKRGRKRKKEGQRRKRRMSMIVCTIQLPTVPLGVPQEASRRVLFLVRIC